MRHLCEHTSLTHLTTSTKYTCGLSIGINVSPGFWHKNWACGLSTSAANDRDFTVDLITEWAYPRLAVQYQHVAHDQVINAHTSRLRLWQIESTCGKKRKKVKTIHRIHCGTFLQSGERFVPEKFLQWDFTAAWTVLNCIIFRTTFWGARQNFSPGHLCIELCQRWNSTTGAATAPTSLYVKKISRFLRQTTT